MTSSSAFHASWHVDLRPSDTTEVDWRPNATVPLFAHAPMLYTGPQALLR